MKKNFKRLTAMALCFSMVCFTGCGSDKDNNGEIGETAENAVIREVQEELGVTPKIARPLWLNQAFFTEDVDNLHYHELCIYFLLDITDTDLLARGEKFTANEGHRTHTFEWLEFERLKDEYFYPLFLKKEIFNIPNIFTIRTEFE